MHPPSQTSSSIAPPLPRPDKTATKNTDPLQPSFPFLLSMHHLPSPPHLPPIFTPNPTPRISLAQPCQPPPAPPHQSLNTANTNQRAYPGSWLVAPNLRLPQRHLEPCDTKQAYTQPPYGLAQHPTSGEWCQAASTRSPVNLA